MHPEQYALRREEHNLVADLNVATDVGSTPSHVIGPLNEKSLMAVIQAFAGLENIFNEESLPRSNYYAALL
jgi:hypothetical protein